MVKLICAFLQLSVAKAPDTGTNMPRQEFKPMIQVLKQ